MKNTDVQILLVYIKALQVEVAICEIHCGGGAGLSKVSPNAFQIKLFVWQDSS